MGKEKWIEQEKEKPPPTGDGARRIWLLVLLASLAGCAIISNRTTDPPSQPTAGHLATAPPRGQPEGGMAWLDPPPPTATPAQTATPAPTVTPQHTITPQPTATPAATATPQPTPTPQPTTDLAPMATAVAAVSNRLANVEQDVSGHGRLLASIQQAQAGQQGNTSLLLYTLAALLVLVLVLVVGLAVVQGRRAETHAPATVPAPPPSPPPAPPLPRPPQNMEELFRLPPPTSFGEQNDENAERLARHIETIPNWREVSKNKSELWRRVWPSYSRQNIPAPSLGGSWHWLMTQALERLQVSSSSSTSR